MLFVILIYLIIIYLPYLIPISYIDFVYYMLHVTQQNETILATVFLRKSFFEIINPENKCLIVMHYSGLLSL